jgi:ferrochelatase
VLLLNFGGPASLDEVRPFLFQIFNDPNILPIRLGFIRSALARFIAWRASARSREKYKLIGGKSPVVDFSLRQAQALQEELEHRERPLRVYPGMRYSPPWIESAFAEALSAGAAEFRIVPLYPHYSITTTRSVFEQFERAYGKAGKPGKATFVKSYESHPGYVNALAEKLRASLDVAGGESRVVFSAHSIPEKWREKDSLYVSGVESTAELVAKAAGLNKYELAYQSGRKGWLGPTVEEKLRELAGEECRSVVVVPLSFTCDNIETLYDIDVKLKAEADRLGVRLYRAESLNDSPLFISALADIVLDMLPGSSE